METMDLFSLEEIKDIIRNEVQKVIKENLRKPFLTIEETCLYLGISRSTLYMWNGKNKIPYYKPEGKNIFYKLEDLDAFILNPKNRIKSHKEIESEVRTKIVLQRMSPKKSKFKLL
jgi:excisionase family DNA binding protein